MASAPSFPLGLRVWAEQRERPGLTWALCGGITDKSNFYVGRVSSNRAEGMEAAESSTKAGGCRRGGGGKVKVTSGDVSTK